MCDYEKEYDQTKGRKCVCVCVCECVYVVCVKKRETGGEKEREKKKVRKRERERRHKSIVVHETRTCTHAQTHGTTYKHMTRNIY